MLAASCLTVCCRVAGSDLLQARRAGRLLPAEDGEARLRQRARPPPRVNAHGNRGVGGGGSDISTRENPGARTRVTEEVLPRRVQDTRDSR